MITLSRCRRRQAFGASFQRHRQGLMITDFEPSDDDLVSAWNAATSRGHPGDVLRLADIVLAVNSVTLDGEWGRKRGGSFRSQICGS